MEYKSQQSLPIECSFSSSPIRHARPPPNKHWVEVLRKPNSPRQKINSTSPNKKLGMQGDRYEPWKNHISPETHQTHVKEFIRSSTHFQEILRKKQTPKRGRSTERSCDKLCENAVKSPEMSPIKQNTSISYISSMGISPKRSSLQSKVRYSVQSNDISSKMQYLQKKFHNLTNEVPESKSPVLEKSIRFSDCSSYTDPVKNSPKKDSLSKYKDTQYVNTSKCKDYNLANELTQDDSYDIISQRSPPVLKRSVTSNAVLESEISDLKKRLEESEKTNKEILGMLDKYLPSLLESKCAKS